MIFDLLRFNLVILNNSIQNRVQKAETEPLLLLKKLILTLHVQIPAKEKKLT